MHWHRIVDRAWHPLILQMRHHRVAVGTGRKFHCILRPAGSGTGGKTRRFDKIAKIFSVAIGNLLPAIELIIENIHFRVEYRGLDRVEPCRHADADIFIAGLSHAVNAAGPHDLCLAVIIDEHRPAITITAKRLGREKAGAGDVGKLANAGVVQAGAEALRRVIHHPQPLGIGEGAYRGIIGGLAKKPDPDHPDNLDAGGAAGLERGGKPGRVEIEGCPVHLGEHRHCAQNRHHLGTGGEGKGGNDNPLARAKPLCQQRQDQRVGSRGTADTMANAGIGGKPFFKGGNLRSHDIGTVV